MKQIHAYQNNGYNIVLDVPSGSVHVVDDLMYETIKALDSGKNEDEARQYLGTVFGAKDGSDSEAIEESLSEVNDLISE